MKMMLGSSVRSRPVFMRLPTKARSVASILVPSHKSSKVDFQHEEDIHKDEHPEADICSLPPYLAGPKEKKVKLDKIPRSRQSS